MGKPKIAKIVAVCWPRWPPCPYMVKTFKNLLLYNRGSLGAESLHESSGTICQLKLLKELSYIDVWPFYGKVKFASLCICMSSIHLNGKIVRVSNDFSSEAWGWIFAQIIGNERSTKVAKRIVVRWHLTFLGRGQVCFPMHLYEPHTFEWENCWEF